MFFPLNFNSINRSRLLHNVPLITPSSDISVNLSNNDLIHDSSVSDDFEELSNGIGNNAAPSFHNSTREMRNNASSSEVVPLLDQVLQETMILDDGGDNTDEEDNDDDYVPPKCVSNSTITRESTKRSALANDDQEKVSLRPNDKT